jgi:two-component sensor histidine kinase
MRLDYRSVLLTINAVQLMAALFVGVYALALRRDGRGAGLWAAGYCLLLVGLILVALRGIIPDLFSILFGNLFLLSSPMLILAGIRQYRGRHTPWPCIAGACGAVLLWVGFFTYILPSTLARLCFFDLSVIAFGAAGAVEIGRKPSPELRVLSRVAAALLLGLASAYLARLLLALLAGAPAELMGAGTAEAAILILGGAMMAGLALALILLHSSILTERLAAASRDNALLVREMAHRTKNDLALVDSLISIEERSRGGGDPIGSARLGALRERIRCLAQAHDRLSRSEDPGRVRLDEYLSVIAEGLPGGLGVRVEMDFARISAPFSFASPLGLAMNELATNALKHAFPEGSGGSIRLSLRLLPGSSSAELEVRDDGVGASWPPERPGLGTLIVQSFASKIGASIAYDFEGGSVFKLRFDLPSEPEGLGA